MDAALRLYGLPLTAENYSRAASALVALRRDSGPSEMAMLNYMIRNYEPTAKLNFGQGAGLAAYMLVNFP